MTPVIILILLLAACFGTGFISIVRMIQRQADANMYVHPDMIHKLRLSFIFMVICAAVAVALILFPGL